MVQIKSSLGIHKKKPPAPLRSAHKYFSGSFFYIFTTLYKNSSEKVMLKRVVANALAKNNPGVFADGKMNEQEKII